MGIDYRLLGPLTVLRDGVPVELGAYRQRALLALLLANAGTVLSTDRILDELWGETSGTDKQGSLWVYVSGLRGALEPGRAKRSEGTVLLTRAPGYVLAVDRADTDVGRFEQAVNEARVSIETDPATASAGLRAALATWRGHAYEEFTYESWAQAEIARLEELRLAAIEDRLDADLRTGMSRELVPELDALVRQHPLRERFVRASMLALHRSGRVAEALRTCAAYRDRLVSELGVEPSRAVRDLEHQILDDDPDLVVHDATTIGTRRPPSGLTVRGYEVREELGRGAFGAVHRAYQPSVGREVAIKVIRPELADDPAFIRRFEAEAQLVARLEHPHIVPLYDYWREPGAAYLVMRLIDAGTLADALVDGALPPERAATVIGQIASALRAAHRSGVVHRDVTPDNILIDRDGNAYLNDFGVAQAADAADPSPIPWYASPEQVAGRPLSPASDTYSLAVVAATALTGMPGEYEQIRGALPPAARAVLDRATATDPHRRYPDAAAFGRDLTEALGTPVTPLLDEPENPYKGLRAFGASDAGDFFGRERLVERLIARLGEPGVRGRFIAVVGPSGSGKSSVVRAGLVPALARGALPMSAEWFRIDMTPAPHPFEELDAALARIDRQPSTGLLDLLLSPGGVRRAVQQVLPDDQTQLLIVVDQFEELFTQVDADTAERFIDELVELVTAPATRARVVVTLRADFYDRPLRHRGLGELLRDGTEVVTPMSAGELGAAISGPANRVGVDVEPAVVSAMASEIIDRPGALPLLQYTMTELFAARTGRTITMTAYEAGGGISRTLARRADSLLAGLGPDAAEAARHVFLRLVNLDDDGGGTVTRRRALVAEVEELEQRGRVQRVLDAFGRHRLVSFDRDPVTRGPTVEISHEALLTEWATLRGWIDDARDDLRTHRHLFAEMTAWAASDGSPDYLLRGGRLDAVAAWAGATTMGLRPAELGFLEASVAARDAEQQARRQEERRTADAERRARRRTRQLAIAAALTALVAVLATFAWVQREDARRAQSDLAGTDEAQRLANLSVAALGDDPEVSLLLAMEAVRATAARGHAAPEAIDAVHWALQELGVQYDVGADTPTAGRFGPGGVRGVWILPVEDLMALADASTDRELTADECRRYFDSGCPAPVSVDGIEYRYGVDPYAGVVDLGQAEIDIAVSAQYEDQLEEWRANFDALGDRYGLRINISQIPYGDSTTQAARATHADVYTVAPQELLELAAARPLLDLRPVVDEQRMIEDYGARLVSLTRIGDDGSWPSDRGPIQGVVIGGNSKALVWTNEPRFTEAGYRAPTDWSSFLALADTMVADGRVPFCLGIQPTGWPATDWVEMVVLRTAGPDAYQAWIDHELPFTDPVVVDAIRTVGELVHRPGYLDTDPEVSARRDFGSAVSALLDEPDGCLMTPFPSFMPSFFGIDDDRPVGSFAFPTFGTAHDHGVVGGVDAAAAVTDRPEIRTLMAALASPDWGLGSAELTWPGSLPFNARFDATTMTNPSIAAQVTGVQEAIRADGFQIDASDAMPPAVSSAFSAGMVRLFEEGSAGDLDELTVAIAADIEAAWPDPGG